ncbi:hypothetical protein [Legionella brunensis]|uniref:Uncharacterized protein n=1 Tax=Legionella brunensis TaxID=29422 RepID=A0A0W0SM41_9GAMM|nr:hypothetical protein [Legionella brunensis]KTC84474.1 hypothetical protein Lbru_1342 [Legionella brunensis]
MNNINFDIVNSLLNEAGEVLNESQLIMENILTISLDDEDTFVVEEIARSLQLTLEYRLSCEDALVSLLNLDHHLLYILGIQPQHSAKINLERLSYALGDNDLKQILHALSQLVDALLRLTRRQQKAQETYLLKKNPSKNRKFNLIIKELQTLILKQKYFLSLIGKLESNLMQLVKFEAIGPIHDHIAAIRGPISQFHQAILHGLANAQLLYQKINKNQTLNYNFGSLFKKAEEVLNLMPSLYQPSPHYSLGHFADKSSEELEQRAAAKRLRPFFNAK